jgi:hypothetical protein
MNYFMIFGNIVALESRLKGRIRRPSNQRNKRLALVFLAISRKNILDKASIKTVEGESLHGIMFTAGLVKWLGCGTEVDLGSGRDGEI